VNRRWREEDGKSVGVLSQALQNRIGAIKYDKGYEGKWQRENQPSAAIIWIEISR
jgi:hypothetical protein